MDARVPAPVCHSVRENHTACRTRPPRQVPRQRVWRYAMLLAMLCRMPWRPAGRFSAASSSMQPAGSQWRQSMPASSPLPDAMSDVQAVCHARGERVRHVRTGVACPAMARVGMAEDGPRHTMTYQRQPAHGEHRRARWGGVGGGGDEDGSMQQALPLPLHSVVNATHVPAKVLRAYW